MMQSSVFEDIRLAWDGAEYVIPADRVLGAIARIEKHLTLKELHENAAGRDTLPLALISMAYGGVLRYAGAKVSDDQVYLGIFGAGGVAARDAVNAAVQGLLTMMIPPSAMVTAADRAAGKKKPAAAKSSRTRIGRRSVPGA